MSTPPLMPGQRIQIVTPQERWPFVVDCEIGTSLRCYEVVSLSQAMQDPHHQTLLGSTPFIVEFEGPPEDDTKLRAHLVSYRDGGLRLVLELDEVPTKETRRAFFRLETPLAKMRYRVYLEVGKGEYFGAKLLNLSGSGAAFTIPVDRDLYVHSEIKFEFQLKSGLRFAQRAEVMHRIDNSPALGASTIGIRFTEISKRSQHNLVRKLVKEQLRRLQEHPPK